MDSSSPDSNSFSLDDVFEGNTIRGHHPGDVVFERFTLTRRLGEGGMGIVWLAQDNVLEREIALKFAPQEALKSEAVIKDLKNETRRGQELSHPNIVRIYDFFRDAQHAAIAMEYVEGETLAVLRVQQPAKVFEPHQIQHWAAQLLDGLAYAHRSARIVHRDLKPSNLIVNKNGDLKIMDFGIASTLQDSVRKGDLEVLGGSAGTIAYMSPQQASGQDPSTSDDVYALGSTLFELFTGRPPFWRGNIKQQLLNDAPPTIRQRREEFRITTQGEFPDAWEEVVFRCLAKDPLERPSSADEVRDMLGLPGSAVAGLGAGLFQLPMPGEEEGGVPDGVRPVTLRPGTGPRVVSGMASTRGATVPPSRGRLPSDGGTAYGGTSARQSRGRVHTQGGQTSLPRQEVLPQPPEEGGGSRAGLWVALVAVLAVAAGGGGWWWTHRPAPVPKPGGEVVSTPSTSQGATSTQGSVSNPSSGTSSTSSPPVVAGGPSTPPIPPPGPADPGPGVKSATAGVAGTPGQRPPLTVPGGYPTIQAALRAAAPGDTVKIAPGQYTEAVNLPSGVSLEAESNGSVTMMADGRFASALRVDGHSSPSRVKGIIFSHTQGEGAAADRRAVVQIISSEVTFEDCVFESGLFDGVSVGGGSRRATFIRCIAQQNPGDGWFVERGGQVRLENCTASANRRSGLRVADRASFVEAVGGVFQGNIGTGISVESGGAFKGSGLRAVDNVENGLAASGTGCQVELEKCAFNHNGFVVEGGSGTSRLSGRGGRGILGRTTLFKLDEVTVENNAQRGIDLDSPVGGTFLRRCVVLRHAIAGIVLVGPQGGADVQVESCESLDSGIGIAVEGQGFSPRLLRNTCSGNRQAGVMISDGAEPYLEGNLLDKNTGTPVDRRRAGPGTVIK